MIDKGRVMSVLDVKPNSIFLDLACGTGMYTIELANCIGDEGVMYAVDLWKEGIETLRNKAAAQHIQNIRTIVADISRNIPLKDNSVDGCLAATIIHDLSKSDQKAVFREVARVLKRNGTLSIIEFKKIERGPGPPVEVRIEEAEIDSAVSIHGFKKVYACEAGPFNYLVKYRKFT